MTSGKLFPLKVWGLGVAISTGGWFCYGRFGAIRVLSVWGFTLSDMRETFPIGGSEGERVCAGGGYF